MYPLGLSYFSTVAGHQLIMQAQIKRGSYLGELPYFTRGIKTVGSLISCQIQNFGQLRFRRSWPCKVLRASCGRLKCIGLPAMSLYFWPTLGFKVGTFHNSGFWTAGTLISVTCTQSLPHLSKISQGHAVSPRLVKNQSSTHAVSPKLVKNRSSTHTISAILVKSTHVVSSTLVKNQSSTHAVSPTHVKNQSNTHAVSPTLVKNQSDTHAVSPTLVKNQSDTHAISPTLVKNQSNTHAVSPTLANIISSETGG